MCLVDGKDRKINGEILIAMLLLVNPNFSFNLSTLLRTDTRRLEVKALLALFFFPSAFFPLNKNRGLYPPSFLPLRDPSLLHPTKQTRYLVQS